MVDPNRVLKGNTYFDNTGRSDVLSGGVTRIPVHTPKGDFSVWTKRTGNNPTIKVLLLHGGPGFTHKYWKDSTAISPARRSSTTTTTNLDRRTATSPTSRISGRSLGSSTRSNRCGRHWGWIGTTSYLFGHSWGGILAIEYALTYRST